MHYWYGDHLSKNEKKFTWNVKNIIGRTSGYNENVEDDINSDLIHDEETHLIHTIKEKTPVTLGKLRHHEPVALPFVMTVNQIKNIKGAYVEIKKAKIVQYHLITWAMHKELYYIGTTNLIIWVYNLRDIAHRDFLPEIIAGAKKLKYPACQQGKVVKIKSEKINKIARDQIVMTPEDLTYMD